MATTRLNPKTLAAAVEKALGEEGKTQLQFNREINQKIGTVQEEIEKLEEGLGKTNASQEVLQATAEAYSSGQTAQRFTLEGDNTPQLEGEKVYFIHFGTPQVFSGITSVLLQQGESQYPLCWGAGEAAPIPLTGETLRLVAGRTLPVWINPPYARVLAECYQDTGYKRMVFSTGDYVEYTEG